MGTLSSVRDRYMVMYPCERKTQYLVEGAFPGLGRISRFHTNQLGIRARELSHSDAYRILTVGASAVLNMYVDQAKTWQKLVEDRLTVQSRRRVWVGAAARSGLTSGDIVTLMHYYLTQFRKVFGTLVVQTGNNDMVVALSKGVDYDPLYFQGLSLARRFERAFVIWPARHQLRGVGGILPVEALRCLKRRLRPQVFHAEGGYYLEKRQARQHGGRVAVAPDLRPALAEFERNLYTIIDAAAEQDIRVVFLTHPSLWRSDLPEEESRLLWFGWLGSSGSYYSTEVLAASIDAYNACTRRACGSRNVPCIDLGMLVPKTAQMLYDDVHLNESGNDYSARIITKHLMDHVLESRLQ